MKSFVWLKHRFLCIVIVFDLNAMARKVVRGLLFGVPNNRDRPKNTDGKLMSYNQTNNNNYNDL